MCDSVVRVVCRFFITSNLCGNRGHAALGRFGPGSRRGYVGMGADKGNPSLSRRAGQRSSRHERKRLDEAVLPVLRDNWTCPRNVIKCNNGFDLKISIYYGIIRPDRADLSGWKLRVGGREQPSVGTSATGHGLNIGARATGLTGTERGKLGRWWRAQRG